MEAATRPYEAVPPEAAEVLRPVLPGLADETIAAIAREVPGYARAMEGEFGQVVRLGVEVALQPLRRPARRPRARRGAARAAPTSTSAAASSTPAAASTRCSPPTASARGWPGAASSRPASPAASPPAIYSLGEAIFAYIDELSAESAEGYAEEQTAAAGESERRRRRLVRLLAQDPPPGAGGRAHRRRRGGLDAAARRRGRARRRRPPSDGAPGEALLDSIAARLARRLGEGAIGAEAFGAAIVFVPDPDAPGPPPPAEAAVERRPAALGPTVVGRWPRGAARDRARDRLARRRAGRGAPAGGAGRGLVVADDHLADLLLAADPAVAADLAASRLAPLAELADGPRARLRETLAAWLDRPGQVQAVAAALDVHPQTVRYRVRQLRDLFGERLEDPDARFELALALRVAMTAPLLPLRADAPARDRSGGHAGPRRDRRRRARRPRRHPAAARASSTSAIPPPCAAAVAAARARCGRQLRRLDRRRRRRGATRRRPRRSTAPPPATSPRRRPRAGAFIVHVSTDYVFDGTRARAVRRVGADRADRRLRPLQARRRARGRRRRARRATRSSARPGCSARTARNFVATMLRLARERDALSVVDDQVGCPTFTGHLAAALVAIAERRLGGLRHVAGAGACSWHDLAAATFAATGADVELARGRTADLGRPAPRPAYSVLRSERPDTPVLPAWQDGLHAYLELGVTA